MTGGRPSSGFAPNYRPAPGQRDPRLVSPVFERVSPPFIAAIAPWLGQGPGTVLEIGAGTGQQAAACARAFPALRWVASDPDPVHRASIRAWQERLQVRAPEPLDIDAATDWAARADVRALGPLSAVVAMNVTHITPWAVTEGILRGAAAALAPGGLVILYGPFHVAGRTIGEGNAAFDRALRAENPDWGLRDTARIEALGEPLGLEFAALLAMPANNRILMLRRA